MATTFADIEIGRWFYIECGGLPGPQLAYKVSDNTMRIRGRDSEARPLWEVETVADRRRVEQQDRARREIIHSPNHSSTWPYGEH